MAVRRVREQFNLLLVEEGEYFFDDVVASQKEVSRDGGRWREGRIKLCSHSIFFAPDDTRQAVLRLPFRHLAEPPSLSLQDDRVVIFVQCTQSVRMRENNLNQPYDFRKGMEQHAFTTPYVGVETVLQKLSSFLRLFEDCQRLRTRDPLNRFIEEWESSIKFDMTRLGSLTENVLVERRAVMVSPLMENPGRLACTEECLYFQPFNNISTHSDNKYPLEEFKRVVKRRYLLHHRGLEIFFRGRLRRKTGGSSIFLSFRSEADRDTVFRTILAQPACNLKPDNMSDITRQWQRKEITNFQYLSFLNSLADRSSNDLTQYPVFPWVIADYQSEHLDLTDPTVFRDLSKPVGALNSKRLEVYRTRYEELKKLSDVDPPFMYGSHYSAPGYVLYFLVRQCPEYMLRLQNGQFDDPNRLFHSVQESFQCSLNNMTDVKELIPEFYDTSLSPVGEFLVNKENLMFGVRQDGIVVGDVVLPPWANSSSDFIEKCAQALESDYVSDHLHQWIDLIFGFKQLGKAAEDANNVFYHLTYEGAVDIDSIQDEVERDAMLRQIQEFGQTPRQLFNQPHPARFSREDAIPPLLIRAPWESEESEAPGREEDSRGRGSAASSSSGRAVPSSSGSGSGSGERSGGGRPELSMPKVGSVEEVPLEQFLEGRITIDRGGRVPANKPQLEPPSPSPQLDVTFVPREPVAGITLQQTQRLHREGINGCVLHTSGVVYTGSQEGTAKLFSLPKKRQIRMASAQTFGSAGLSSCTLLRHDRVFCEGDETVHPTLALGSLNNNIYLYSASFGRVISTLRAHDDAVSGLSSCRSRLVSGGWDAQVKMWDIEPVSGQSGTVMTEPVVEYGDHETEVKCVDVSLCGTLAVSGADDGVVNVFDGRVRRAVHSHAETRRGSISSCLLCEDQRHIFSACDDGTLRVNLLDGTELFSQSLASPPICLCWGSPNSVFAGCRDGSVCLWTPETGELMEYGAAPSCSSPALSMSYARVVSTDTGLLVTSHKDGQLSSWEVSDR